MKLDEIKDTYDLSKRAYNVCKINGLDTSDEILRYFRKWNSFIGLKQSGDFTNKELTFICQKLEKTQSAGLRLFISRLNEAERQLIETTIGTERNKLNNRAQNVLLQIYGKGNLDIVHEALGEHEHTFLRHRNVGLKTELELRSFFDSVYQKICDLYELNKTEDLGRQNKENILSDTIGVYNTSNLTSMNLLELVELMLLEGNKFKKRERQIINAGGICLFSNQEHKDRTQLSKEIGLTRERIRQLRELLPLQIKDALSFVESSKSDFKEKINLELDSDIITIDENYANRINNQYNTNLSSAIIALVISKLQHTHKLVGEVKDLLYPHTHKARTRHQFSCLYLINEELVSAFDFDRFLLSIAVRLNKKIKKTYNLELKGYLFDFLGHENVSAEKLERLNSILKEMLFYEFDLIVSIDNQLVFKQNTTITRPQYALKALEALDTPSTIEEIVSYLNEKHPSKSFSEDSMRPVMQRTHGIVPMGRNSTYALESWDESKENHRGGTIREMVIEFLESKTLPASREDILEHILQFRETNKRSLFSSMKSHPDKPFAYFENNTIGLKSKKYPSDYVEKESVTIQSFQEKLENLTDFIKENRRLPRHKPQNEAKLARFVTLTKQKIRKKEIPAQKEEEFKRVISLLSDTIIF
jgi:hypothetical protein